MTSPYKGKVALVTGASAGIGAKIVEELVKGGLVVVGAARRVNLIEELAEKLKGQPGRVVPRKLDVSNEQEVVDTIKWIDSELGGLTVLVNNAAVLHSGSIYELSTEKLRSMLEVNVFGTTVAIREAVQSFIKRNVKDAYIVNINSMAGHTVPYFPNASLGFYPATKHALTAIGEVLRQALHDAKLKIRVTSISPGATESEMTQQMCDEGVLDLFLKAEDVAKSVAFALSLPLSAEITELTIRPTGEVYGGQ